MSRRKQLNPRAVKGLTPPPLPPPPSSSSPLAITSLSPSPALQLLQEPNEEQRYSTSRSSAETSSPFQDEEGQDPLYRCSFCPDSFPSPSLLKHHEQVHASLMPHRCKHCGKGFKHKRSQDRHEQLHTGYKKHKCPHCEAAFFRSDHLKLHLRTHESGQRTPIGNGSEPATPKSQCSACFRSFPSPEQLLAHMDSQHGSLFEERKSPLHCVKCPTSEFATQESYELHLRAVHSPSRSTEIACGLCGIMMQGTEALQKHTLEAHSMNELEKGHSLLRRSSGKRKGADEDLRYECLLCPKSFDSILALHQHGSSAHPKDEIKCESPVVEKQLSAAHSPSARRLLSFICEICTSSFKSQYELDTHLVNHFMQRESSYTCGSCRKAFNDPEELQKHLFDVHTAHVFKCSLCNDLFQSRVDIQVHYTVMHSKELVEWRCRSCNAVFHSEAEFHVHVEVVHIHRQLSAPPGSPPFPCPVCPLRFPTESQLALHVPQHSVFKCSLCDEAFNVEFLYERHVETAHGSHPFALPPHGKNSKSIMPDDEVRPDESEDSEPRRKSSVPGPEGLIFPPPSDNSSLLKCNICDSKFPSPEALSAHKLKHCKVTQSDLCHSCQGRMTSRQAFYSHMKRHNVCNGVPISCVVCCQSLQSPAELELHANFHLEKDGPRDGSLPFQCIKCQRSFPSEEAIQAHVASHVLADGVEHPCRLCQQVLDSPAKLQCHLIEHSFAGCSQFQCYLCGSVFSLPEPLREHMLNHSGDQRPYDCSECEQKFFFRSELDHHMGSHVERMREEREEEEEEDEEKEEVKEEVTSPGVSEPDPRETTTPNQAPFPCPNCSKSFGSLSALQGHSHIHMTSKNHRCRKCDRTFPTASKLKNHLRQHNGDRPFNCSVCGRRFSRRDNLKVHMRTHCRIGDLPTMVTLPKIATAGEESAF